MILKRKLIINNSSILLKRIKVKKTKFFASCPCLDCTTSNCIKTEQSICFYINHHKFNFKGKYRYHVIET